MASFDEVGGWPAVLRRLTQREDLDADEARASMDVILRGDASNAQIAAFIVGLRIKGESAAEVDGLVDAMLAASSPLILDDPDSTVDIVGTGGSTTLGGRAFNVSTMASLVAAAAGATVCKHGNRKASSASGSTDLLEALGIEVELDGASVARCVREAGVGFAFARVFHPAMRHAAPVRAELGVPTVFNVLGPLSHPGRVRRQVLGVTDPALVDLIASVLARRSAIHSWVVHGLDGLDELTTTAPTRVLEVRDGEIREFEVVPEDVGIARATIEDIAVGDTGENLRAARSVLDGEPGPVRDMVVLNAAAALVVAGQADDLSAGVRRASSALDSGAAKQTLARLVASSRSLTAD